MFGGGGIVVGVRFVMMLLFVVVLVPVVCVRWCGTSGQAMGKTRHIAFRAL